MVKTNRRSVLVGLASMSGLIAGCSTLRNVGNSTRIRWEYDAERTTGGAEKSRLSVCFNCDGLDYSPAVADDTIYVGGDVLAALDPADGSERWTFETGPPTASRPVVANATVFVVAAYYAGGSHDQGRVYAVDAHTGELQWEASPDTLTMNLVAATDGVCVVGDSDDVKGGDHDTIAFDADTGEEVWRVETGDVHRAGLPYEDTIILDVPYGVLAVDTATGAEQWYRDGSLGGIIGSNLYVPGTDGLTALDPKSGEINWYFGANRKMLSDYVARETVAFAGLDDGTVVAIEAATGAEKWRKNIEGGIRALAMRSNRLYVGGRTESGARLGILDAKTGEHLRENRYPDRRRLCRLSVGSSLFGYFCPEDVYAALNPETGETRWEVSRDGDLTEVVFTDELALIGAEDGVLYAIEDR